MEGASGKTAIPFLPSPWETGEVAVRDGGGPIRALWATAAAGIEGERERELRGIDPLPHLERRWLVAAWLQRAEACAAAALWEQRRSYGGGGGSWWRRATRRGLLKPE